MNRTESNRFIGDILASCEADMPKRETRKDIIQHESRPLYLKPIKVDKQRAEIKKIMKRYESIVSELKMLLDMKAKDRKMISGLISKWLKTLE